MALSQNEDFAIWYLRTAYLNSAKDGIAERLISVNSSVLNTPGFRAAGWSGDQVHRTHSPPIPTASQTHYFRPGVGISRLDSQGDDEDEGGMITGRLTNDTIGPGIHVRRRRRKEQIEDDDSSDLSDESDEDEEVAQRAAQQIRFSKMPARDRSDSSPLRTRDEQDQDATPGLPPGKPSMTGRRRGSSLGAVEAVKARARADTATSSEMSSENEVDPTYFQRRQVKMRKPTRARFAEDAVILEDNEPGEPLTAVSTQDDFDAGSIDSDLSSDLEDTVESASLDNQSRGILQTSSPILPGVAESDARTTQELPKKARNFAPLMQDLPPARPISFILPRSALSMALNAQKPAPENPIQEFAALSARDTPDPLWIRIYPTLSRDPESPFEMPLVKISKSGSLVIVAEAIGLALWRYCEEELKPALDPQQLDVNKWCLRMVEDGEVDFDFPALQRTKPITDFTSNNNRGARARSRGRPYDEFALVECSAQEYTANTRETPTFSPTSKAPTPSNVPLASASSRTGNMMPPPLRIPETRPNLLVAGQPFGTALSDRSVTPADQPTPIISRSTPRLGVMKTIRIRYFELDESAQSTTMELSTDSYIAEILDHVCKRWNFDKALFVLKVAGTNTVAPLDRTIEALGPRSDLELVRKRFFGAGPPGSTGSPASASPSAPLLLDILGPKKGKKSNPYQQQSLAQKQDLMTSAMNFKKYYVTRKQLRSFAQGTSRVLIFDGDFLHNMPTDTGKTFDAHAKTNSFAFGDITKCKVSTKHSKLIRLFIRTSEKRYDFEARTSGEAQEIVTEINKEIEAARRS